MEVQKIVQTAFAVVVGAAAVGNLSGLTTESRMASIRFLKGTETLKWGRQFMLLHQKPPCPRPRARKKKACPTNRKGAQLRIRRPPSGGEVALCRTGRRRSRIILFHPAALHTNLLGMRTSLKAPITPSITFEPHSEF
jgi:hypothetical protein